MQTQRRPWYRLHLSTWLVLLVIVAGLTVIIVPGERIPAFFSAGVEIFEHGWPWPFLTQQRIYSPPAIPPSPPPIWAPPWCVARAWSLSVGKDDEFHPWSLVGDVGVALGVLLAVAVGFEWWRRRRRAWQFSLRELLVLILLVSLVLSWLVRHRIQHQREVATQKHLWKNDVFLGGEITQAWLRRLIGMQHLEMFRHPTHATLSSNSPKPRSRRGLAALVEHAESLPDLTGLSIGYDKLSDEDFAPIARLTQLEEVDIDVSLRDDSLAHLRTLKQLRRLELLSPKLTGTGTHHLAGLERLRYVRLQTTELNDAGLAFLECLPNLDGLDIQSDVVTGEGLRHLAGLSQLRVLRMEGSRLGGPGVQYLANLTNLRRLSLRGGQMVDEDLVFLNSLTSLDELEIDLPYLSDTGLRHLAGLTRLRRLKITTIERLGAGLTVLKGLPYLKELRLHAWSVDEEGIECLKQLDQLRVLEIRGTNATKELKKTLPNCRVSKSPSL